MFFSEFDNKHIHIGNNEINCGSQFFFQPKYDNVFISGINIFQIGLQIHRSDQTVKIH